MDLKEVKSYYLKGEYYENNLEDMLNKRRVFNVFFFYIESIFLGVWLVCLVLINVTCVFYGEMLWF